MEAAGNSEFEKAALAHLGDLEVEAWVELGRKTLRLGEVAALESGSVVVLDRLAGSEFALKINGVLLGEGETALVGERMTYQITQLAPTAGQEVSP